MKKVGVVGAKIARIAVQSGKVIHSPSIPSSSFPPSFLIYVYIYERSNFIIGCNSKPICCGHRLQRSIACRTGMTLPSQLFFFLYFYFVFCFILRSYCILNTIIRNLRLRFGWLPQQSLWWTHFLVHPSKRSLVSPRPPML